MSRVSLNTLSSRARSLGLIRRQDTYESSWIPDLQDLRSPLYKTVMSVAVMILALLPKVGHGHDQAIELLSFCIQ